LTLGAVKDLSCVCAHEGVEEGIEAALSMHLAGLRPQDSPQPLSLLPSSTLRNREAGRQADRQTRKQDLITNWSVRG